MNNKCHVEDDLNKVSKIMKEREEKAFRYNCLIKRIKEERELAQNKYNKWRTHIGRLKYEGKIELCDSLLLEEENEE